MKPVAWLLPGVLGACALACAQPIHITHEFANRNAHSLIGMPSGSRKTLVEMDGGLRWSQWDLKHKPLDSPFGFSGQMDGAVDIHTFRGETALRAGKQSLLEGRYPFVVTQFNGDGLACEELAFPVEGTDIVRVRCANRTAAPLALETRISGKWHNLPGHADGQTLVTRDSRLIAEIQGGACSARSNGLELACRWTAPANSAAVFWLKSPHDGKAVRDGSGDALLDEARNVWNTIWTKGPQLHLPNRELEDFFYSSAAYVLILTEYDAAGDFWILDGPAGYRQFWGRGEYFQARSLNLLGLTDLARKSVEHAFHIQMEDGQWDGPPISGWPSWDNIGGNAAGAWDSFLFTHDRAWLEQAYPHLIAAAKWIRYHREESDLETGDVPAGAKPIRRQIPWSCRTETSPPLAPGEKPYWSGLLPWSYGDSGLPEGHSFPHNFFALYAEEVARLAAVELGHDGDAAWLAGEIRDYRAAILASIQRALKLEKDGPPYLPAMPTYPEGSISQSFLAVYPTAFYSPHDPLVDGLLARMERHEIHGLPTNMAWLGEGGVWPGESMNVAETYLRRGDVDKAVKMLAAALNHSYGTNVWREEIRVDKTLPRACPNSTNNRNLDNGQGTGDMPEAWGNANLVNLVRDMLLLEDGGTLQVLPGIPAGWIAVGQEISLRNAPTVLGGTVSLRLAYPQAGRMTLELDGLSRAVDVVARFPVPGALVAATADGQPVPVEGSAVKLTRARGNLRVEARW
jgi:hypothetical protein